MKNKLGPNIDYLEMNPISLYQFPKSKEQILITGLYSAW